MTKSERSETLTDTRQPKRCSYIFIPHTYFLLYAPSLLLTG